MVGKPGHRYGKLRSFSPKIHSCSNRFVQNTISTFYHKQIINASVRGGNHYYPKYISTLEGANISTVKCAYLERSGQLGVIFGEESDTYNVVDILPEEAAINA